MRTWLKRQFNEFPNQARLASDSWRFFIAVIVGAIASFVVRPTLAKVFGLELDGQATVFLMYSLVAAFYVWLTMYVFGRLSHRGLQDRLRDTSATRRALITQIWRGETGTSMAVIFSLIALLAVVTVQVRRATGDEASSLGISVAALLTVVGAWVVNAMSFALHYARDDAEQPTQGFHFPDEVNPVWSDYTYVAFQVSATFATSDVACVTRRRRRLVTIHTVIAFAFNSVIIAQTVSIFLGA